MDALEGLDFEIYRRLDHGRAFEELGEFELEGDYYRFNCPECERKQIKGKNTFFAKKGLPFGRCRICGYRLSWWKKYGSETQGLKRLCEMVGFPNDSLTAESQGHLLKAFRNADLLEELYYFTNAFLFEDPHAEALAYLYAKDFDVEEMREAELGYYPAGEEVKEHLLSQGYSLDELNEAGTLDPELGHQYKLVVPFRNGACRATGMFAYSLAGGTGWPDKRLFCSRETTLPFHLNIALRSKEFKDSKRLIIVDEPLEAAMLGSMGISNVIAPLGDRLTQEGLTFLKKYGVTALVFCQKGVTPEKPHELTSAITGLDDIDLYTVEIRGAKDLIEYIRPRGHAALKRLLARATAIPKGDVSKETEPGKEKPVAAGMGVVGLPSKGPVSFSTKEVLERAAGRRQLKTGYPTLDKLPMASQGELAVIMGEQGCGKTLLALNLLLNIMCYHEDLCFVLLSSEASEHLTLVRLLGILSGAPSSQIEEEFKKGEHTLEVKKGLDLLKGLGLQERFHFSSQPDLSPEVIFSYVKMLSTKGMPLGAIFIDELYLIREEKDSLETSRRLKSMRMLADTMNTALICTLAMASERVLGPLDIQSLQPYASTVLKLNIPEEGVLSSLKGIQSGPGREEKRLIVNVLSPSGRDTPSQAKFYIKPGGKIVEQG